MDLATVIGIGGAFIMVIFGIITSGGDINLYLHLPSVLITFGGSVFATIGSNPMRNVKRLFAVIQTALRNQKHDPVETILVLLSFSEKARREGLLALEDDLDEVTDQFLKSGVQLVVDGTEPELVKSIMMAEINSLDARHNVLRKMIEDMATFAPAFGMTGTLIGLILMMRNLGGDPGAIGAGMAAALLTTLYGVVLANALFLPLHNKLDKNNDIEINMKEIVVEGALSIQAGDNPRILQRKLTSYFPLEVREKINEEIGE